MEKGIITGCSMSAILFSLTMNMLVKTAEVECQVLCLDQESVNHQ